MLTATFGTTTVFPEILGELPYFSDQANMSHLNQNAWSRSFDRIEEDESLQVPQNDQFLWATLGTWDL
jgi:hypothetical protein